MTEKSFTVDWLIKDFGPKVWFNLKKICHTEAVWDSLSISRISMVENKLSLFQKKSFLQVNHILMFQVKIGSETGKADRKSVV